MLVETLHGARQAATITVFRPSQLPVLRLRMKSLRKDVPQTSAGDAATPLAGLRTSLAQWAEREHRDRDTAVDAIQAIAQLGYRIVPPDDRALGDSASGDDHSFGLSTPLSVAEGSQRELAELLRIWSSRRDDEPEWNTPDRYRHLGRRLLKLGAAPVANEVVQFALGVSRFDADGKEYRPWANDAELRQIHGLALARTGNPDAAQRVLAELHDDGLVDEETLGILARTYKDQAMAGGAEQSALLQKSLELYEEAYRATGGYWSGINVATLARLVSRGHADREAFERRSREVAEQVWRSCLEALEGARAQGADPYWILATLGEAALNLNDLAAAGEYYRQAYASAPKRFGDLNTTRRHARWLLEQMSEDVSLLDEWLPIPTVVVFAGHLIDKEGRSPERFPERLADTAKASIRQWLTDNHALIGYSSAACGADILFQEALQELGGETHVVLPCEAASFEADSVHAGTTGDWPRRFHAVLDAATSVITASQQKMSAGGISYDYANLMIHGLAALRARALEKQPVGLCVWDGKPGDGPGGTASVVARWHDRKVPVYRVNLAHIPDESIKRLPIIRDDTPRHAPASESVAGDTRIMAMIFGDAVNYSRLTEEQVPRFVQHFLKPIAELLARKYAETNVVRNTWGDGLYLVFDSVRDAGRCALDICELVNDHVQAQKWAQVGLPAELNVRLALHAGPVFRCDDPVTGQINYTGTHVSRAARLEPKTPPGEVYASEAFAAFAAVDDIADFTCEYVKQLDWAKHYGSFPTYVLHRRK